MRAVLSLLILAACSGSSDDELLTVEGGTLVTGTTASATPPWPDWAFTHWVWEDESTQASATALVDGYLARDIPVGAVIIDSPWATGYSTFEWDTERFPDPEGFVDDMHAKGVRVFVWTVPAINVDVQPLYDEAAEAGYFMKVNADAEGPGVIDWWKGQGSLIDYWNPEAVAWWHELLDKTLATDIDGWKCDGLDYNAIRIPYSPGAGRTIDRLEYSHAYYRDFHDYTREQLGKDRLNTLRPIDNYGAGIGGDVAAFGPVDITWAGWVGDQDATFEGLVAALDNMYWSADYGYVAFGSDIGGYRANGEGPQGRSKEVFLRWAQQGAFVPVMENGGGGRHEPWAWDEETVDIYRTYVELHMALLPYLNEQGGIAFAEGRTLTPFVSRDDYSYFLGPDLFVAPMLASGTSRVVTLPEGDWVWLFDDDVTGSEGDVLTLDVPLDRFPVFVRKGHPLLATLRDVL